MLRTSLLYGAIAGVITISVMTLGLVMNGGQGATASQAFGYLTMLIALSLIFVGVKQHRDKHLGGVIKFMPAFGMGLMIAFVAAVFYILGWESYLAATDHAFIDTYVAGVIEAKKAAGIAPEALAKLEKDMAAMAENYANPLLRLPMTFIEIFPVGFVVALVSAAILKNPGAFPAR